MTNYEAERQERTDAEPTHPADERPGVEAYQSNGRLYLCEESLNGSAWFSIDEDDEALMEVRE